MSKAKTASVKTESAKIAEAPKTPTITDTSTAPARQTATPDRIDAIEKAFAPVIDRLAPKADDDGEPHADQAPSTSTTPEPQAAPQGTPVDDTKGQILKEKLDALRAKRAADAQRSKFTQERSQFDQQRQKHEAEVKRLADLGITPDMTPLQINEHLQRRALAEKDPVLRAHLEIEQLKKQNEALIKRIDENEARSVVKENQAHRSDAERTVLGIVKDAKYEILHDYLMSEQEIVVTMHHAADAIRADRQVKGIDPESFTYQDVADRMLRDIQTRDSHLNKRRSQKTPQAQSEQSGGTSSEANGAATGGTQQAQAAANPLNPALADRRDSGTRPLSEKERKALVERQFEPYLKKRGYRE